MTDRNRVKHIAHRLLVEGDHFGEITMLYGCIRTCSVISRSYSTLARLHYPRFRMLVAEQPSLKKELLKWVWQYDDPNITFLKKLVGQLEFF